MKHNIMVAPDDVFIFEVFIHILCSMRFTEYGDFPWSKWLYTNTLPLPYMLHLSMKYLPQLVVLCIQSHGKQDTEQLCQHHALRGRNIPGAQHNASQVHGIEYALCSLLTTQHITAGMSMLQLTAYNTTHHRWYRVCSSSLLTTQAHHFISRQRYLVKNVLFNSNELCSISVTEPYQQNSVYTSPFQMNFFN